GLTTTEYPAEFPPYNQVYSDAKEQFLIADNSACSPYKEFAKRHSAYASWIQEGLDSDTILDKISEQIVSHHLSFDNFINLIRFFRLYQQKILFHNSAAHKTLFTNAIAAYEKLMNPLYTLIIKDNSTLLDALTCYDDYTLVGSIVNQANEFKSASEHLMHSAIRNDANKTLVFLYSIHPEAKNANALAAISSQNAPSLLFTAAEHNAKACAFLIISEITKAQLLNLMKQTNQQNESIMHYLAKNNAVAIYNKIIEQCGTTTNFQALVPEQQNNDPFKIIGTALAANAVEFCSAYNQNIPLYYPIPNTLIWSALNSYSSELSLKAFTWLQNQFINKYEWLNYLQLEKSDKTIMYDVLFNGYFSLALHLLKDFNDINDCEKIHPLLSRSKYCPLEALTYGCVDRPQEMHEFFMRILQIYNHHPDKLVKLLTQDYYKAFNAIFTSQNFELFDTILKKFSYGTKNYSIFYNSKIKTDTILNALIKASTINDRNTKIISLTTAKKFIAMLVGYCSKTDKKELLLRINYTLITGDLLEYLLQAIDAKNDHDFLADWTQLDKECLLNNVFKQERNNDAKFYQVLFSYYIFQHSKQSIQKFVLNQWTTLVDKEVIHKNPFLFRVVYSLFRDEKIIRKQLIKEKLQFDLKDPNFLHFNYRRIMHQFTDEPSKNLQNNLSVLLWSMLVQAMITKNTGVTVYLSESIIKVLNPMIKVIQINNSNALSVFKLEDPADLAILTSYLQQDQLDVEGVAHAIKLILINCTQEQRIELINSYHEKLSGRYKDAIMAELETYVASLKKLDILIELKAELSGTTKMKNTPGFFSNFSREYLELGVPLKAIDPNKMVYFNYNEQWLYITTEEINNAWKEVLELVTLKIQKDHAPNLDPFNFSKILLKYQQKMIKIDSTETNEKVYPLSCTAF
ncbi:MAG: hypothetical protein WC627_11845, partial [Legionella sp.]